MKKLFLGQKRAFYVVAFSYSLGFLTWCGVQSFILLGTIDQQQDELRYILCLIAGVIFLAMVLAALTIVAVRLIAGKYPFYEKT